MADAPGLRRCQVVLRVYADPTGHPYCVFVG